jgi:hypothetical protein
VIDYSVLYNHDRTIFEHLANDWGFPLSFFAFKSIYKSDRLHPAIDISSYIKNKSLLQQAVTIEMSLRELGMFNKTRQALFGV